MTDKLKRGAGLSEKVVMEEPLILPLLPVRELIVFPHMVVPLLVGRVKSLEAVENAWEKNKLIFICSQKSAQVEDPGRRDIFGVGVVSEILQSLRMPDGSAKVLIEGKMRARIQKFVTDKPFFQVQISPILPTIEDSAELKALVRSVNSQFEQYIKLNPRIPSEIASSVINIEEPDRLADVVAAHIGFKLDDKQQILEIPYPEGRLQKLTEVLTKEIEILRIETKIHGQVRKQMEKTQKEYYLHEQMRAIQKELGKKDEHALEVEELSRKVKKARMSKEAEGKAKKELERLARMHPTSPEAAVVYNYLDWLVNLPWSKQTKDSLNIENAERILNEDHYGLKKVKERILEFLAVRTLVKKMKGPILCFVGPPGVGKTSLARSIARTLGRNFVRMSLGGVRDEAEIRGHRRTYIGALPGRIVQSVRKAKTRNPVFLLDEVDKMSVDFRGDPSAALLEVLDPEQNNTFNDHYLEVDFDLSDVFFITTANVQDYIPIPLQDRMEIISIPGYTEEEKLKIAELFLIPKQLKANGLKKSVIRFSSSSIRSIIHLYTREAGVRNLEREIASICRKVAKTVVRDKKKKQTKITSFNLHKYLGPPKYRHSKAEKHDEIGVATGLAWTESGGDIMATEASVMRGKGNLILTGQLGEVMQESGQAALSYIRARARKLNIDENFYKNVDIHIHVPEGAIPKDGPSAGITMAAAVASALTQRPVRNDVAMTGEITLRGRVLPIGGVKSKVLAAHRGEIKTVVLPKENKKDLAEIPAKIRRQMNFVLVEDMDEVLNIALANGIRKRSARKSQQTVRKKSGRNVTRRVE